MVKHVVVIASGETERRALPQLLKFLQPDILVDDVRTPARNKALSVQVIAGLIRAAWFEKLDEPPKKFVVVVDVDRADPAVVLRPIQEGLPGHLAGVNADIQYAYARAHLEAWYFGDAQNLRGYVGKDLGSVDTSKPDEIFNPKHHLTQLLGIYTAGISAKIAQRVDAATIAGRSPSFRVLVDAVKNGADDAATSVVDRQEPERSSRTSPRSWLPRFTWRRR